MEIATGCMATQRTVVDFTSPPNGAFRVPYSQKKSKTIEFFDELYTYPPKFRVKWDTIDELHEDLFMSYNYRRCNQAPTFLDAIEDLFTPNNDQPVKKTKYLFNSYLEGYLNNITSSRFYGADAKYLQKTLQTIPIYTILNSQGEIVLASSTDSIVSNTTNINQLAYDVCGNFDPVIERDNQLGLFFMSRNDAEVYLNEIAKTDTQGTKMFGLSIHCFGLDFAYRVTREYHPNLDFRFVPDLNQLQTIMTSNNTGNSNLIFENGQQQLRFRRRSINILPVFSRLNKWFSPFSSFLEKSEYYKGVPIFIVQVNPIPTNFVKNSYHILMNTVGNVYGRFTNVIGAGFGFGNGWILQGSLADQKFAPKAQTYVFFDQGEASDFCQRYSRKVVKYSGKRATFVDTLFSKPNIFAYNLEDFLEMWEESLAPNNTVSSTSSQNTNLDFTSIKFISPKQTKADIDQYMQQDTNSSFRKTQQFFDFKYRRLKGFFEVLLNT